MNTSTSLKKDNQINDLILFLSNSRPEIRKSSITIVLSLTSTDEGIAQLVRCGIMKPLCRMLGDLRKIAQDAIKVLINITASEPLSIEEGVQYDIIRRIMNQFDEEINHVHSHLNLLIMLLANITTNEKGAESLMNDGYQLTSKNWDHYILKNLIIIFVESKPIKNENNEINDKYQYIANILGNISQLESGRKFLLNINHQEINPINKTPVGSLLANHLYSENVIRRRGILTMIRNICFDNENHYFLYEEIKIIPKLLYLLHGPEILTNDEKDGMCPSVYMQTDLFYNEKNEKIREQDEQVRKSIIDTFLLLCVSRNGRKKLRKEKVYPIVRNAHITENNEEISEQLYKLVNFLIRDEEGEEPDWNEIQAKSIELENKEINHKDETLNHLNKTSYKKLNDTIENKDNVDINSKEEPEEEIISDELVTALSSEIDILNVSSDDEDDDIPALV